MTEQEFAEHVLEQHDKPNEYLVRSFPVELAPGDGRTVDVRIVPFGERGIANDGLGGVAVGIPYQEEWVPGVFAGQEKAANRVLANVEHERGIAGIVGHGLTLREAADGVHGSFRLHDTPDGEKALMLIREGVFEGVSLEARPMKNIRTAGGVVQRVKAHLRGIAFCREGAFASARVLAVREQTFLDDELILPDISADLVERARRAGLRLPESLVAHPNEEAGTPDESGTPADVGTRPDLDNLDGQE